MNDTALPHAPSNDEILVEISALLDGELDQRRLLEVIDRIADTEECRMFYRKSRALSGVVAATAPVAQESAPEHLWTRIARRTGLEESVDESASEQTGLLASVSSWLSGWTRSELAPMVATAAILVALAGLTWVGLRDPGSDRRPLSPSPLVTEDRDGTRTVTLGSDDDMSESRFIDLATEILQADHRYRRELLRLMTDIEAGTGTEEGFSEGLREERTESGRSSREELGIEPLEDGEDGSRVRVPRW